jgi:uncharacterized repeat protein (TIGR01451 family)
MLKRTLSTLAVIVLRGGAGRDRRRLLPSGIRTTLVTVCAVFLFVTATRAVFSNGGFEIGTAGLPPFGWIVQTFMNPTPNGFTPLTPQTRSGLNLAPGGVPRTVTLSAPGGAGTQADPDLGAGTSLRWPRYGNQAVIVNQHSSSMFGAAENVNSLSQTVTIGASDVDPVDGQVHIRFAFAPVLEVAVHPLTQQPYYFIQVTNITQANTVLYTDFAVPDQAGIPWQKVPGAAHTFDYTEWQLVDVAPGSPALNLGDQVELRVMAAGCALGAHMGEVYVDGVGAVTPGLSVEATGTATAAAGSNIAYDLTVRNGSPLAATNVLLRFTTPPNTTFQSLIPPAGAVCIAPLVGTSGTVNCNFTGPVPAGAADRASVTVSVASGATGAIVARNYAIMSTEETPLLGPPVTTTIGAPPPPPQPPVVSAGADQTLTANAIGQASVTLTGSATSSSVLPLTVAWTLGSTPVGTTPSVTVTLALGAYAFTFSATDSNGLTTSATTHVSIQLPTIAGSTGPTGPQGPTGAQGEQGLKGDTGLPGPAGPAGPTGPSGQNGNSIRLSQTPFSVVECPSGSGQAYEIVDGTGALVQGSRTVICVGAAGPQGTQGAKGDTGVGGQGPVGPPGPQGPAGVGISSPVIFLLPGMTPPSGYVLIGTFEGEIKPVVGARRDNDDERGVRLLVYRKP